MRYSQIWGIIAEYKPKIILEIGTHKAQRPLEWAQFCNFIYFGFDVFDDGTFELNQKEMNGKGFCTESYADSQLKDIPHKLYRGLSTETVPQFKRDYGRCVDFAFIDGGHSLDTILQDYENVCEVMNPGGIIVFDDYYTPEIKDFGCNQVVKDIPHEVLPHKDKFDKAIQLVKVIYGAE